MARKRPATAMKPIETRRIRWMVNGEVAEQDCALVSPEQWEEAKRLNPKLALWGVFRFGPLCAVVNFPVGLSLAAKRSIPDF